MKIIDQKNKLRGKAIDLKNKIFAGPKTLRSQLVVSIWVGLAIFFIPANMISNILARREAIQETQKTLQEQASFVYFGVKKWRQSTSDLLETLAFAPPIRKLDQSETLEIFNRLSVLFPYRAWRLWNREGDLLVATNIVEPSTRKRALAHEYFLKSRNGIPSHGIYKNCLIGKPCYIESVPIYGPGISAFSTSSDLPVGVLSLTIPLEDSAKDSGLNNIYSEINDMIDTGESMGSKKPPSNSISLQNRDYKGLEILQISNQGQILFPMDTVNDKISMQSIQAIKEGPWGPLVNIGKQAKWQGKFTITISGGRKYFTYTKKIDNEWNLMALSDEQSIYDRVNQKIIKSILYQLIGLAVATIVIIQVCKNAAKPIQLAGKTINEFSKGNFEERIHINRDDEIGELYENINKTGASLRNLLNIQLAHAVTDQQIKTATDIQKGFIVEKLPSSKSVELAGEFDPAYEIGADWYDALSIGDITYVVIADVCDKGIASALFMSVFRSLTRYSIFDEHSELEEQGLRQSLEDTITQVNDYMADNHGMSSMFATLFLGAYENTTHKLSYICAGHELPIIIRETGVFEYLEPTGPAIGIFGGSTYGVNTLELLPGQILFTYTDGLVDARSPQNTSWGIDGVKNVLKNINPKTTSAKELLEKMQDKVNEHRGNADQFDDLTMLIMKINQT